MGCGSGTASNAPIKIFITLQATNSYVDSFPLFVIVKIKEKFDNYCKDKVGGQQLKQFKQFYSQLQFNDVIMKNLFDFFVDNRSQVLKFRIFMIKYATILKCQDQTFSKILYEIYKQNSMEQIMSRTDYQSFINSQRQFFAFNPGVGDPDLKFIKKQQFFKLLNEAGFYWKDFRYKFNLIDKKDIPFQEINRELIDNEISGLIIDTYYYVISTDWFERWSFYYQGQNHHVDQQSLKSTKLMIKDRKTIQRLSTLKKNRNSIIASDQTYLVEQPTRIEFDDIEGQYEGQLKEGLNPSTQCRYITEKLWKLLIKMHPPNQIFRRKAISSTNLQLYPKTVYFYETNQNGSINYKSLKIFHLGVKTKMNTLSNKNQLAYFLKEFNDRNWTQIKGQKMLGQCTTTSRFFVVGTDKRIQFIEKNTRKSITLDNLSVGDFVYADFPYQKQAAGAFIMNIDGEKALIHFKGYSYKYEEYFQLKQLSINQNELVSSIQIKRKTQFYQGLANIGNTCFINSTIQCLLSTPILDEYLLLQQNKFSRSKSPLLYEVAAIGTKLLNNQQASPYELKKAININLQVFSGNDQHDAQEFLGMLLDKMNQQHPKKPTVIEELFGGKIMSTLTCLECKNIKEINQSFYTLSLPIPEPQFLYYTVIIVPIQYGNLKKFYFKFHKTGLVKDFIQQFEHQTGGQITDYVIVQMIMGSLKNVRTDISVENNRKKLFDISLSEDGDIYAFQKLGLQFYNELLSLKNRSDNSQFVDFYLQKQKSWTLARIREKKKQQSRIQIINSDNEIQSMKVNRQEDVLVNKLGSKFVDQFYKKVFQRKYNLSLKKYEIFGIQYLITYPKWASYNDLTLIVLRAIQNMNKNSSGKFNIRKTENFEHVIRLLQASKGVCVFCGQDTTSKFKDKMCCKIADKDIPLPWVIKKKSFFICIDWINFQNYNSLFFTEIDIDSSSKAVERQKNQSKTNLIECLNKFKLPQKVQMTCDKCKKDQQSLQTIISVIPNILVIHMKQFRYTSDGNLLKIHIKLQWQQFLDITKYTINNKGNIYELYAFVMHEGSVHGGHYTCTAKRKQFNQGKKVWVNFDDEITNILKEQAKNIDSAYLLFFKKVDMPTSAYLNFTDIIGSNI